MTGKNPYLLLPVKRTGYLLLLLLFLSPWHTWAQHDAWVRLGNWPEKDYDTRIREAHALKTSFPDSSKALLQELLKESWYNRNVPVMKTTLAALSYLYELPGFREQALRYAQRAIQLCDTLKDQSLLKSLYDNMGKIYYSSALYSKSLECGLKAAYYTRNDPVDLAKIENNMVFVLHTIGEDSLVKIYLNRSLKTAERYRDGELWATTLLNLARLAPKGSRLQSYYQDSGLAVAARFKRHDIVYRGLLNKSSFLAEQGKPDQALRILEQLDTLEPYTHIYPEWKLKAEEVRGSAYIRMGKYQLAERYLRKSVQQSLGTHNWMIALNELVKLYEASRDYKKAYQTYRGMREAIDSLVNSNLRARVQDLELQYRTAEKDRLLAENKLQLARNESALKEKSMGMTILSIVAVLLLVILALLRRNYRHRRNIMLAEQKNQNLQERINGEEMERSRIARELHDGIGGILSAVKISMGPLRPTDTGQLARYQHSVQLMDEAYNELRWTAHNLSQHILQTKGLAATLGILCERYNDSHGLNIRFQHFGDLSLLPREIALSAYRIVQELVQNIVKHSHSTDAMVQVGYQEHHLTINVEDNGRGMATGYTEKGIGLNNITERVNVLKGQLEIDSREGEGTTVYISIDI